MKLNYYFVLFFVLLTSLSAHGQGGLIVNEVSQGVSGAKEYAELVVVGPPCTTVDLRNWVFDDNNGDFLGCGSQGSSGIAMGHIRFMNVPTWEAVPVGTIILVYAYDSDATNQADISPYDPTQPDFDDDNCDFVRIVPLNGSSINHIEQNPDFPNSSGVDSYNMGSYQPFSNALFSLVGLRNGGDAFQTRRPDFSLFHGIGYGQGANATCTGAPANGIYVNGSGGNTIYGFFNSTSDDYYVDANFGSASATTSQTPGLANNCDNAEWIVSMRRPRFVIDNGCVAPPDEVIEMCIGDVETLGLFNCELGSGGETVGSSISGTGGISISSTGTASITFEAVSAGQTTYSLFVSPVVPMNNPVGDCNVGDPYTRTWIINISDGGGNPILTDIEACEEADGMTSFDLTTVENVVNDGSGNAVTYYSNAGQTVVIPNPSDYSVSVNSTVYTTSAGGDCGDTEGEISLILLPAPAANLVNESLCDTGNGTANFDLFNIATQVNGLTGNTVNFYMNSNGTGSIATTGSYNTGTITIYAEVTNNSSNCESAIVPINLEVTPAADPADIDISVSPSTGCGQVDVELTLTLPTPGTFDIIIEEQNSVSNNIPFNNVTNGDVLDFFGVTENTTYTIISIESANGCTTALNISESVTITTASSANAAVLVECDDDSGSISFNLTDAASDINGNSSETVNYYTDSAGNFPISPADALDFQVSGNTTVYVSTGTPPCESNLETLNLIIDPQGTATIGGDATICAGDNTNLVVTFTNGTPLYSFDLLTNGGSAQVFNNINSFSTTIPVSPTSTTTYTIANAIGNGCAMTEAGNAEIIVSTAPTVTLSPNQSICEGESGEIVFTFTGTPPFTFTYTANNANPVSDVANSFTYTINPSPTVTTTYTVTALSDTNCPGTTPVSTEITVTATETANDALLTGCLNNAGNAIFNLNDAAAQISTNAGSTINFYTDAAAMNLISTAEAMNYSIAANTTVYATIGSGTCQSNIVDVVLEIAPQGTATIAADEEICQGESVNLVVTFVGGSPPYSFILQSNGSTVQSFNNINTNVFNIPAQTVFFSTTYTVFNAQSDNGNCAMLEDGSAEITISPTPTVDVSGDQTICEGEDASVVFTFTGTAPYDVTYLTNNGNPQSFTTNDPVFILDVSPAINTTYTVSEFEDMNCEGTVTGSATIQVTPLPTAEISMDGTVCEGESYDLTIDFTGEAPFSFVYTIDGNLQTELTTSEDPFTLTVNPTAMTTVYGLDMVSTGTCEGMVSINTATVTVSEAPTVTLISSICSADNSTYNVVFEITGGTPPYTVTGGGGDLDPSGTIFTSDNINSQTNYNFSIDDALNCGPVPFSGTQDCSCLNSAGTMDFPANLTELCESESFTFTHNGDEIVEIGDVFGFIIHESSEPELSLPFQWNPSSATFDFTGFLQLNTIYYVSAVTGDPDDMSTNPFDINDPCLSVSAGVPVVWRPNPTAILTADESVCAGEEATLTFDFTGTAPYTYTYNVNGVVPSITQQTSNNQEVINIPITENTTVTLENVEDAICNVDINQAVNIDFNEEITAIITDTICSADITSYQIEITVIGEGPFSVAGNSGVFVDNVFTSDIITSGDPYYFEVTDANACNTIILDGLFVCEYACTGELGEMSLDALNLCVGETAMAVYDNTNEDIEPGDLIQYVIHGNPGENLGTPILIQNDPNFAWDPTLYMPNTVYYISAISGDDNGMGEVDLDDPCLLVNEGQLVVWNQGTAYFTSTDVDICGGESACVNLTIEVEGIPNYEITISDGMGGEEIITDFNTTIVYQVCPDVETTYTITSVTTNECSGTVGMPSSVTVSPQPAFTFENLQYDCTPDNTQYIAMFGLIGGTPPYVLLSGGGTLGGADYVSDLIDNNVPETVEFIDDLGCTLSVSLQSNCDCMNAPAIVDTEIQELCLGEFSEIIILSDPIWGPGDVSAFFLHDGTATEIGTTIYDTTNDIFNTEPTGYTPGDTLYFTPVVSEDDGNGLPDLDDSCVNIGIGFPVVWYEPSQLNVPESITSCSTDCQDFTYTFFQEGEHVLELNINSNLQTFTSIDGAVVVTICPADYGVENGGVVELIPVTLTNQGGCVTTYNGSPVTQLEIIAPQITNLNEQICMGDSLLIGTTVFDIENQTGEVILQNQANCDSIINVTLTFYDMPEGDFMTTLCPGGSIDIGGTIFDEANDSGSVILTEASYLGCDSLLNVSVTFSDAVTFALDTFVCAGSSATINGEVYDATNTTGSFTFDNGSYLGCDSIVEVSLFFFDPVSSDVSFDLCEGASVQVGDVIFDEMNPSGPAVLVGEAFNGCDSTVNVTTNFFSEVIFDLSGTFCSDTSFTIEGIVFDINNPMGSVTIPMGSFAGCDSTIVVDLEFYPVVVTDIEMTLCTGDSFEAGGEIFDETTPEGTVIIENGTFNGCDSTINVILMFNDVITADLDTTICENGSFVINGTTYDANNLTGTEEFPMGSYLGCDSVLNVMLTIAQPAIAVYNDQLCEGDLLDIEGIIYDIDNPTGTQILTVPSFVGCDSIAEVNLSFLPNAVGVLDTILCAGDFAIIGGVTIDEDNPSSTFTFPDMAFNGCDSILTVNATFIPATEGSINVTLEFGESFILGGVEFDQDNLSGEVTLENQSFTGCDSIVTVNVMYLLDVGGLGLPPNCFGEANGSIRVDTILYGIPPYTVTLEGQLYGSFSTFPYFITGLAAGEYDVLFTDAGNSLNDAKIIVPNASELILDLGDDEEIKQGETFTIEALTNMPEFEIADLIWTPTDSLDNDTTLTVTTNTLESITYSLLLRDSTGCTITDNITIYVNEERFVYIPSAFSPNDDGVNDVFTIFASEQVREIKTLNIFDRWGNQVFTNVNFSPNDLSVGWNGEFGGDKMNNSVFVYVAEIEFIDGKIEVMKGDVTLIR